MDKVFQDDDDIHAYSGNHLPHWESKTRCIYHISFHLADSVPPAQIKIWLSERKRLSELLQREHREYTSYEIEYLNYLYSENIEYYLNSGYGACLLKKEEVASIVRQAIEYNHTKRYLLKCWCIMPNHVHILVSFLSFNDMRDILHGWKSYTAHKINRLLGRTGPLWEPDAYNHIIRTPEEYYQQSRYIWNNPEKAGMKNWPWRWSCLHSEHESDS